MNFPFLNNSCKWNHTIFVTFCLAYRTMFSRFFYAAAHIRTSFFYMVTNILLLVYSILFIHLSVGHVGCFYLLTVVNNPTGNNIIYLSEMFSKLLDIYLRVNLPGHMVVQCVTFQVTTTSFPQRQHHFIFPPPKQEFQFLHILANMFFCVFLKVITVGVKWLVPH